MRLIRCAIYPAAIILTAGLSVRAQNLDLTPRIAPTECIQGCVLPLSLVSFEDMDMKVKAIQVKQCNSSLYLDSVYNCANHYCSTEQVEDGWVALQATCEASGISIPLTDKLVSLDEIAVVDCVKSKGKTFNGTIIPSEENFALAKKSIYVRDKQVIYDHAFGWALWILVGSMTIAGLILRFCNYISSRSSRQASTPRSELAPVDNRSNTVKTLYRKHIALPKLFGESQPTHGLYTLPSRLQTFWIALYISINVIFSCVGYTVFEGNFLIPNQTTQLWTWIGHRTGIMAWYNLPLIWLLAGRNDFILFITGVSYSTLNVFHRWAARVFTVQAIVHSIAHTVLSKNRLALSWDHLFWRAGVFATCVVSLSLVVSILPIRKRAYEIFLVTHITLAVVLLVLLYYHVLISQKRYDPWIWACVGIWCFDRLVRYVRLCSLSMSAIKGHNAQAEITGREHGLIRLTIKTNSILTPNAGQYYFLYQPKSITPWENHPFTLASWSKDSNGHTDLTFLIAVHHGATKRLREKIENGQNTMRVLVEGPYGHGLNLGFYDHLLFISGGSGITAVLPYIDKFKQTKKSIKTLWCVKNNHYATDVLQRELKDCQEVVLHVTQEERHRRGSEAILSDIVHVAQENNKEVLGDKASLVSSEASGVAVVTGRPDFEYLIQDHMSRLHGAEKLGIVACGPNGMLDDLRQTMVSLYGTGEGKVSAAQVDYFEESFSW